MSIDVSFFPKNGIDADTLIPKADVTMYVAKQNTAGFAMYSKGFDQHDLMPPDDFIPLAERTRLIDDLTVWVVIKSRQHCSV